MRVPARPVPPSVYKASFDVQRSVKPRETRAQARPVRVIS
jgi:hypothetical protein